MNQNDFLSFYSSEIAEIGLLSGGEHLQSKICRFLTCENTSYTKYSYILYSSHIPQAIRFYFTLYFFVGI